MSGALTGFLPGSVSSLLGATRLAAWRGVTFAMLDSRDTVGRRWAHFLFPGRDDTAHQDLGALDGPVSINGLAIGDDYIRRAARLRAAFRQPGPGLLIHPWLGELKVVLAEPAEISFSDQELRVARFTAAFLPWTEFAPPPLDTLGALLDRVDTLRDELRLWLGSTLAPFGTAIGLVAWAESYLGYASGLWHGLLGVGRSGGDESITAAPPLGLVTAAVVTALAALEQGAPSFSTSYGSAVADQLALMPDAVSGAAAAPSRSMVAPAADAAASPGPVNPREVALLLLRVAASLDPAKAGELLAVPPAVAAVPVTARLLAAAAAVEVSADIPVTSADEAAAWRDQVEGTLASLAADMAAAAPAGPTAIRGPWQALREVRSAWAADMTTRIGRLPSVRSLEVPAPMSAWLIAQKIAGDDPAAVAAALRMVVARNRIRHPAMVPAGRIEILA